MGYVGWGLVAEQANTTTGGAQRTVGITSSPGAGIAQSSLNSVNNGGGGVVNNYGAVWDNLFVRQYLFGRGEQGAWFDPSDFQPNWRRNLLTYTEQFDNAAWVNTIAGTGIAATVTANQGTAPDGTTTADRIQFNLGGGTTTSDITRRRQSYVTPATTHTFSLYLRSFDGVSTYNMHLVSSDGSTVNIVVTGTWQRFVVTAVGTGSPVSYAVGLRGGQTPANSNTADVLVWGAQLETGTQATAYQPITDGIVDYLTYQPQPILYQDSSGTTPVTALEQPCGLMLDKSKGLQLGPELASAPFTDSAVWLDVVSNITNRTATSFTTSGTGGVQLGGSGSIVQNNKRYRVAITWAKSDATTAFSVRMQTGIDAISSTAASGVFLLNENVINGTVYLRLSAAATVTITSISVRELPGNHAYQTTSAKRPVVSARVNLLTYTEQFDNAAWTKRGTATITPNDAIAPNGTLTADRLSGLDGGTNDLFNADYLLVIYGPSGLSYTPSIYIKRISTSGTFIVSNPTNATLGQWNVDMAQLPDAWVRITATTPGVTVVNAFVTSASGQGGMLLRGLTGGPLSMHIWGADARPANQATGLLPLYQRVNTSTDYETNGFPGYLKADGIDDFLQTNSIDFTATDKITLCAGVRKLSDATGMVAELSTTVDTNNGSFNLLAPSLSGANSYRFNSKGTVVAAAGTGVFAAAPDTSVLTGIGNISGDVATLRRNGSVVETVTTDQGTGNFGNYPAYFFHRNTSPATVRFNGYEYGNVAVGKLLTADQLTALETYMNDLTKAY